MDNVVALAGYEVSHEWGDGGHNGEHATNSSRSSCRLWKRTPRRPQRPASARRRCKEIRDIRAKIGSSSAKAINSPKGGGHGGEVIFNDIPNSKTYKIKDGKAVERIADS